jgi:hypothetical protein
MNNHEYAETHGLQTVTGARLIAGAAISRSLVYVADDDGNVLDTFSKRDFNEIVRAGVQTPGGLVINW